MTARVRGRDEPDPGIQRPARCTGHRDPEEVSARPDRTVSRTSGSSAPHQEPSRARGPSGEPGEVLAFLGLGANWGRPRSQLSWAIGQLARAEPVQVVAVASLYGSTPVGVTDQPDFLNTVVAVRTDLTAEQLLDLGLELESRAGRVRQRRWGPRPLDVDLLWYDARVIRHPPRLEVPHPRLAERAFVLVPWAEIAPDTWVPGHGTVADLAAAVDRSGVWLEESGPWWTRPEGDPPPTH